MYGVGGIDREKQVRNETEIKNFHNSSRAGQVPRSLKISGIYHILKNEPIGIDFFSDKFKHMAFKHSYWLEPNYCIQI